MNQFKVFKHPVGTIEAVKQGWCWPAFFFGFMWALFSKMWVIGLSVIALIFLIGMVTGPDISDGANGFINLCGFILAIVFGLKGNAWREENLRSRGFDLIDTVTASNKDGAIALALKNIVAH